MALINCADCGRQVSDAAVACPQCGRPIAGPPVMAQVMQQHNRDATVGDAVKGIGTAAVGTAKAAWSMPLAIIGLLLPAPIIWMIAATGLEWYLGTGLAVMLSFPITFALEAAFFFLYFSGKK